MLGHHVTVLTTDTLSTTKRFPVLHETINGVTVIRCRNKISALRRLNLSSPFGLGQALRVLQPTPDIIHCHELRTVENLLVASANRAGRIPIIVSPHGTLPQNTGRAAVKRTWDLLFGKSLARCFSGVLALTMSEAEMAGDWWSAVRVTAPVINVIPNGVDLPDLYHRQELAISVTLNAFPPRNPLAGSYSRSAFKEGLTVLFMGRLHERKGVQLLIPAFAQVNVPNSRLLIVGPDEGMLGTLRQLAQKYGISDKVIFTGLLPGALRDQALARADIFVLPAVGEGLSIAALEAMAAGLPVILTPGCNLPEAETQGAGLIVERDSEPLAEAIRGLLTDASTREAMGAAGHRWMAEAFSWPSIADRTVAFYQTLRGKSPHRRIDS